MRKFISSKNENIIFKVQNKLYSFKKIMKCAYVTVQEEY